MLNEMWKMTACEAVDELKNGNVSPLELIDVAENRINSVDKTLNALPTTCFDRARKKANSLIKGYPNGKYPRGFLHGLPIAIKDLMKVAGVRCTMGSKLYKDYIPEVSDVLVERLEEAGAIIIGKSNTPEFGAGANTFNEVFGATRNPWNLGMTCGGSSGGAAVALSTGQVWLAHGSDLGGSLRTPASFCGVTGLRPSPGRVPHSPSKFPFGTLFVDGPMARNAQDVGLFLDAMSGHEPSDPLSYSSPQSSYRDAAEQRMLPKRIAYSPDLGFAPVDSEVSSICKNIINVMKNGGAKVDIVTPDLSGAMETFHILRAAQFANEKGHLLDEFPGQLKPELVWNIEKGLNLTTEEINNAEILRGEIYQRFVSFFKDYDLLVCPAAIVPPFDINNRYLEKSGNTIFENYIDWIAITYVLSLSACPIASTPAGMTNSGLPVGLQLVAPPRREDIAISSAAWLENSLGLNKKLPINPSKT